MMHRRTFILGAAAFGFAGHAIPSEEDSPHRANANSRITLLYLGQVSCIYCRGYEAEYFGRMDKMSTSFPEFKEIDYLHLSMGSGRAIVTAFQLPDHLKWIANEKRDGRAILQNRGTPFFAGIVDNEVWAQGHGVSSLEGSVIPALRRAIREKRTAA